MSDVPSLAETTFRDYVIDGVPSSGEHKPPKAEIRAIMNTIGEEIDAIGPGAAEAAATAVAAAEAAEEAAANAAIGYLSFATTAEMEAHTTASDAQTAYDAETDSYYRWDDGGSEWVLVRAAEGPQIAALGTRIETVEESVGDLPTGVHANAIVIRNEGGWITGILDPAEIESLRTDLTAVEEQLEELEWATEFTTVWSTNGRDIVINEGGWVLKDYDTGMEAALELAAVRPTETDARVAAIHGAEVEAAPFLAGDNLVFSWGESKAVVSTKIKTYLDQLVAAYAPGGTYPAGAAVTTEQYSLGGQTMAENMTAGQLALMRAELDAGFAAGAEAVTAWTLVEQANDMIRKTTVPQWEADIRRALDIIRRESLQRYVGTDPDAPVPVPPVIMPAECGAWAGYGGPELQPDIMLHAIQLSHEIYNLCISFPDYVWTYNADNLHDAGIDTDIAAAYSALAIFHWRVLGKKYHPTQVREWWYVGSSAYLRCEMPQAPLVSDTSRVTAIDDEGLTAYQADGTPIAITGVTIVGGGRVLKVDQASDWVAGDQIWGAMVGDGGSGRVDGPRSTLHDSSPYAVTIGASSFPLYSYLLPFKITL